MHTKPYDFEGLADVFRAEIDGQRIWDDRLLSQQILLSMLRKRFGAQGDVYRNSFAFNPGVMYFATPLTTDPAYTQPMKPTWYSIKQGIEQLEGGKAWKQVYAPFDQTDPYSKTPDALDSYELSELDHVKVLIAELGLCDLNRGSNGVGRETELGLIVGEPFIGFSQSRVSRMDKGSPGIIVLSYETPSELIDTLLEIFDRKSPETEPFYVHRRHEHSVQTVMKGGTCLNCKYKSIIHPA